jgi:energy-coupling factor transporter ATP-binding protein EcfA2
MILIGENVIEVVALTLALTLLGQLAAWLVHKYTLLGAFNLYPLLGLAVAILAAAVAMHVSTLALAAVIALVPIAAVTVTAGRRRMHALGAGGDLRTHELERRWIWQPAPARTPGERLHLDRQGEIVHRKPWSSHLPYVSMTDQRDAGPRLPLGQGQHVFLVGATGSGKTTTARRLIAARVLAQRSSLVVLDQKGDLDDVDQMRRLAAAAGVPFVLFDAQDPDSDRWQPLWGTPGSVTARATEAIKESEPYYYDVLRKHLDIVCKVLHAADVWPPSVPYLIDACEPENYKAVLAMARQLPTQHADLTRRAARHAGWVKSRKGTEDLGGGTLRLEAALALASRRVVTPRLTPEGSMVAVNLADALKRRAVVMWRTHADEMPDEAAALTAVALSDLHASAAQDVGPWTLLLDEFGAVIQHTSLRALGILQRGRSHGGQALVATQSVADVEALTNTAGLLDSLTDNFAAVVAHRQSSPDSRDWLSRLMGTRELWQSTNQTDGHGIRLSGRGSSRRVREFIVPPDIFATLGVGEAVIYTPEGRQAQRAAITPLMLPDAAAERIDLDGPQHPIEMAIHPEQVIGLPATVGPRTTDTGNDESAQLELADDDQHPFEKL